jgi:hypothetical protein
LRTPPIDHPRAASADAAGVVIETKRLQIRSLRDDDLADLVALINNWEVARWVSSVPHPYSEATGETGLHSCSKTTQPVVRCASRLH